MLKKLAQTNYDNALANLKNAQANLDLAKANLELLRRLLVKSQQTSHQLVTKATRVRTTLPRLIQIRIKRPTTLLRITAQL